MIHQSWIQGAACLCLFTFLPSDFVLVRHAGGEPWIKLGFVYNLGMFCRSFAALSVFVYRENSVTCITGTVNALQRSEGVLH